MNKKFNFNLNNSLAQQCYDQLHQEIITGILKPGSKIRIQTIKDKFLIGQSPIREALSRLVAYNLVETKDNRGFWVATISEESIKDTFIAFTAIENLLLKIAIKKGGNEWEGHIVSELHKLELIEQSTKRAPLEIWIHQNYVFHYALVAGCKSPLLLEMRNQLYLKFERYCRLSFETNLENLAHNHTEHATLAKAILTRNAKEATKIMTHHLNESLNTIMANLKNQKLI